MRDLRNPQFFRRGDLARLGNSIERKDLECVYFGKAELSPSNAPYTYYYSATAHWRLGALSTAYTTKRLSVDINRLNAERFVAQADLWDDMLIGTVGVRHDVNSNRNRFVLGGVDSLTLPDKFGDRLEAATHTVSYGVVAHPVRWLSLHYSKSENFMPNAGTVEFMGSAAHQKLVPQVNGLRCRGGLTRESLRGVI